MRRWTSSAAFVLNEKETRSVPLREIAQLDRAVFGEGFFAARPMTKGMRLSHPVTSTKLGLRWTAF